MSHRAGGMSKGGPMGASFVGLQTSPEKWLEIKQYPKPGSEGTGRNSKSLHRKGDGVAVDEWLKSMIDTTISDMIDEYVMLKLADQSTPIVAAKPSKSRYQDTGLHEKTRVLLKDKLPGTFIHASWIDGFMQKRAYISTQAPMEDTMVDFWRLVWQEHVIVVVMLTKVFEGTTKSVVYWPGPKNAKRRYGPFLVRNVGVVHGTTYSMTELNVTDLRSNDSRVVTHFLYTDWPDQCVPSDLAQFMNLMDQVRKCQYQQLKKTKSWKKKMSGPPILVHCSAGIGRTGTYQAIDICYHRFIATSKIDIPGTVEKLRQQRQGSVQTNEQYILIYAAVLHMVKGVGLLDTQMMDFQRMVRKWE